MVAVARAKEHLLEVRTLIGQGLSQLFARKKAFVSEVDPSLAPIVDAIDALTTRGGKRLRPALVYAGYAAVRSGVPPPEVLDAGLGVELFQTYLLVQDDWMDEDAVRRGGPSMHMALRDVYPDPHMANSMAILAGDLACAWATELLSSADAHIGRTTARSLAKMHEDVVLGQILDVAGNGPVETVHRLKTSAYTVTGPLVVGAQLAEATDDQLKALEAFAEPIGVAFQLRDDVLGTFGDPDATGKSAGNDLRANKHTALVDDARANMSESELAEFERALRPDATDAEVEAARALLVSTGARERVETRIDELSKNSRQALLTSSFSDEAKQLLTGYGTLLARRSK